jgi:hypothetical protein
MRSGARHRNSFSPGQPTARPVSGVLALVMLASLALAFAMPQIGQDRAYYEFVDTRAFLGIPNALNVLSNAGFLLAGAIGLGLCLRAKPPGAGVSWIVFFAGVALVTFGSGYYHWAPDDEALTWDRLPMTVAFVAFFVGVAAEHLDARLEQRLLPIGLAVGIASVAWWRYSGDLRLYGWVQFAPMLGLVVLLALSPGSFGGRGFLLAGFACYAAAKLAEVFDASIFAATAGVVSGHTLKHLLAALTPLCVYLMLRRRLGDDSSPPREAGTQASPHPV